MPNSNYSLADTFIHEMELGNRVVAIFHTMNEAEEVCDEVCRKCHPQADGFTSHKSNGRVFVEKGGGSIRFTSDRAQLRGYACDVLYIDPEAVFRDWMAPLRAIARATFDPRAANAE